MPMKSNVWRPFVFVVDVVTEVGIARTYSKQSVVSLLTSRAVHPRASGVLPFQAYLWNKYAYLSLVRAGTLIRKRVSFRCRV